MQKHLMKWISSSVSHFSGTDFNIRFCFIWLFLPNGCPDPFQRSVKRISTYVSLNFFERFNETDFEIHFTLLLNEFQHMFQKKTHTHKKQIKKQWNGSWNPFLVFVKQICDVRFIKKMKKKAKTDLEIHFSILWNEFDQGFEVEPLHRCNSFTVSYHS